MVAADGEDLGDDVLFADMAFGNVFNGNARSAGQLGGTRSHAIAKRFGKSRIVEDADLTCREKCRHPFRIARPWQGTGDDDPVVAREHPGEAVAVTLRQQSLHPFPPAPGLSCVYIILFGSGFAGLGGVNDR